MSQQLQVLGLLRELWCMNDKLQINKVNKRSIRCHFFDLLLIFLFDSFQYFFWCICFSSISLSLLCAFQLRGACWIIDIWYSWLFISKLQRNITGWKCFSHWTQWLWAMHHAACDRFARRTRKVNTRSFGKEKCGRADVLGIHKAV